VAARRVAINAEQGRIGFNTQWPHTRAGLECQDCRAIYANHIERRVVAKNVVLDELSQLGA
jgi:hypothetical protein